MYQIQKTAFGSRLTLAGTFTVEEAKQFQSELAELRAANSGPRGSIVDIRTLVPPEPRVVDIITETLEQASMSGLNRAAIIVSSPVVKGQAVQVTFRAEAAGLIRFFDASKIENWEELSLEWVVNGVESEVKPITARIRTSAL